MFLFILSALFLSCRSIINELPMETERERAESALIILGNPPGTYPVNISDIPQLINYTRDPDPAVRHMAVFQLGQLNVTSFYKDLLPLLIDDDISVSRNTEELLLKNKKRAAKVFRNSLFSKEKTLMLKMLDLLKKIDDQESLSSVIELFLSEDKEIVDKAVSTAAALAKINDKILYDSLLRPEAEIRIGIVKTLSLMGDPSILGTLLPYFYDPDIRVQNAVKFAFVDFGDKSIPYLVNVLNNPVPETQLAVLGLFEALKSQESIAPMISLFDNDDRRVRERAIYTVSLFKDTALDELGKALKSKNEQIVIQSILLLGKISDKKSLDYLMTMLESPNSQIREIAIQNILLFGTEAGDRFLSIIDRRDKDKYDFAVNGLMNLKDKRLIVDGSTSLFNRNNRSRALVLYANKEELKSYLTDLDISGLLKRDISSIGEIYQYSGTLTATVREIRETGSKYTSYYLSRNDFLQKAEDALQLSFTYMRAYMNNNNPEDLERAKNQKGYSEEFKRSAEELNNQLENYVGSGDRERELIHIFEESKSRIIDLYESVSINRKNLADQILKEFGLTYQLVVEGTF